MRMYVMMRKAVFDTAWIVMNATVNHSNRVIVVTYFL